MITLNNKNRFKIEFENYYKIPLANTEQIRKKFHDIANNKIEKFNPEKGIEGIKQLKEFENKYIEFNDQGDIICLKEKFLKEYKSIIEDMLNEHLVKKTKLTKTMIYCYLLSEKERYELMDLITSYRTFEELKKKGTLLEHFKTLKKLISQNSVRNTEELETIEKLKRNYIEEMKQYDISYILLDCLQDLNTSEKIKEDKELFVTVFNNVWNMFLKKERYY